MRSWRRITSEDPELEKRNHDDGAGYILTNYVPSFSQVTVSAWIYLSSDAGYPNVCGTAYSSNGFILGEGAGGGAMAWYAGTNRAPAGMSLDTWHHLVGTYDGNDLTLYIDGVSKSGVQHSGIIFNGYVFSIGYGGPGGDTNWNGFISNIQIYNTSLSANEVSALYLEGIGGAPIDPTHIVGWWPLNGNAQDYSGNNNGGVPTNVVYTSSWASGYTAP